ncbi:MULTISPECIES: hypothetical protein [Prochlorococcus]|uniref:hypothetical protein n=1 Tax=Prochlorococcus TaxID=1218 RepID=UPI000B31165F|nr:MULTISPECIES: hypothetical protein [Prochlorococcus]NMO83554.1 hypothetical protein [Prochlorococcus sp. P1344]NMP05906.1 hypothetical protein [Prochlorococcus sp. P1361]NMP12932.1 hypothetical protein [Prochlorococcus sp.P1363]
MSCTGHAAYYYRESGQLLQSSTYLQSCLQTLGEENASHYIYKREQQGWIKRDHQAAATKKLDRATTALLRRLLL